MPINNINTLQNYKDLKYTRDLAKQDESGVLNTDYYIHALANLEQRNEYRYSNGIKYGILTYDEDVIISTNDEKYGDTTFLELNNDMSFDIYVNDIETYLKHSQIYNDGVRFKSLLFGKILGSDDTEESNNVEIQYTDIDLNTHTITEAYRVFYLNDGNTNNLYILIHLKQIVSDVNEYKYKLTVHKLNIQSNAEYFRKLFRASSYESANQLKDIFSGDDQISIGVNNISIFDELIDRTSIYSSETIENNYTLECTYDTIEEQLIKITDESMLSTSYSKINELLYFNYYNISQYVRAINNDLTVTYPNILKYYSNKQFNSNSDTLKMMIAKSLFSSIYNEIGKGYLKIPRNTKVTYVSNVENALQIYYTDDIYVYFINDSASNLAANSGIKGIQYVYSGNDKTIIYNIYSKYNTKYTEFVDSFLVDKKYVLPYIDDSHLWNINDNQTTIYASGESAGNPNIFIVRTNYDTSHNPVIYGTQLNRNDIQQNLLTYRVQSRHIKYKNSATGKINSYEYMFAVPVINKKSIDKLKYATLFIISSIIRTGEDKYNPNAQTVTTIWTISDNTNDGGQGFAPVTLDGNPMSPPIMFDDLFGLDESIYRKFAEYGHISNVFDDLIGLKLPKTILNGSETNTNNYFVIERNTLLDKNNSEQYPEHAYNHNLVEMKIGNKLMGKDFSYSESSLFINQRKLFNEWSYNGSLITKKYGVGKITFYEESYADIIDNIATTVDSDNGDLQQTAASPVLSEIRRTGQDITGVFDYDVINKYSCDYENKKVTAVNEYLPTGYLPILKEANVLHQDSNVISRTNLYSFTGHPNSENSEGVYYAYIGTTCRDDDKSILRIGTSDFSYMINLGKESLISSYVEDSADIFKPTETLSIDLAYTYINSNKTKIAFTEADKIVTVNNYNYNNDNNNNNDNNDNNNLNISTIQINHIINSSNETDMIIPDIFLNSSTTATPLANNTLDLHTRFTDINLNTGGSSQLLNYLSDYKEYFGNATITFINDNVNNNDNNVNNNDNNNVKRHISGTYVKDNRLFLFDTPLLLHIVKVGTSTTIYI